MGFFGNLSERFKGMFGSQDKSVIVGSSGSVSALDGVSAIDAYRSQAKPNNKQLIEAGIRDVAFACASLNANTVAGTKLRVYSVGRGGRSTNLRSVKSVGSIPGTVLVEDYNHPLCKLLRRPNDYHDGYQFQILIGLYLEIVGSAYVLLEGSGSSPDQMWVLPAQNVDVVRDHNGFVSSYRYNGGSQIIEYSVNDIIAFHNPNPVDPYGPGLSPLSTVWLAKQLLDKDRSHSLSTLDNRARPDAIVSGKSDFTTMGTEQAIRIERDLNRRLKFGGNGKLLVLEGALDITPLTFSSQDLDSIARIGVTKVEIANAFGVPMSMLETKDVNRANAEAGLYQHASTAIMPRCVLRQERFNTELAPLFGNVVMMYDDPVPENAERSLAVAIAMVETGAMTINEWRAQNGMSDVIWGESPWINGAVRRTVPMVNERHELEMMKLRARAESI